MMDDSYLEKVSLSKDEYATAERELRDVLSEFLEDGAYSMHFDENLELLSAALAHVNKADDPFSIMCMQDDIAEMIPNTDHPFYIHTMIHIFHTCRLRLEGMTATMH